ncbi:MAG: WbqC family protein [Desulfotomaculum sp.]|nr:WbqC family protein [Desulfotomaculum sp.]
MPKIVAIHQPNYLPWIGYFHKMMSCDVFVIADDVKLSTSSITHRNKIKCTSGVLLLTVPLAIKRVIIKDVIIYNEINWGEKHFQSLQHCYARSRYWSDYKEHFRDIYSKKWEKIIDLNMTLINLIRKILEIKTPMVFSSQLPNLKGRKSERIVDICKKLKGDVYLSGQGARVYNDEQFFNQEDIELRYQQFKHPVYPQLWGEFVDKLSVVDLIFNCGPESKKILEGCSYEEG